MTYFQRCLSIFFFLAAFFVQDASAQYWERVTTVPAAYQNTYWLDVFFLPSNSNYGWVCGYNGHVLRTTDGGATWSGATVPFQSGGGNQDGHLESVHFVSQSVGYASGPTGVFKSMDGGVSWLEITPLQAAGVWGCYFLTSDIGVVVGGNCGIQEFFYTDNGGATWTRSQLAFTNTKLSDCILYEDGYGLAAGSGRIFETLDSGKSWQLAENTGSNIWHEEISAFGNSILVPTAGSDCDGTGSAGGMRFFDGSQWRSTVNSTPMFGAFLLDQSTGWACGYNRAMYFTGDAGRTWQLKNCGITGSLDDVWFINSSLGWAVGGSVVFDGNGLTYTKGDIYKYSPSKRLLSETALEFPDICFTTLDTTWIVNKSFEPVIAQYTINGDKEFSIISPASTTVTIPACDSIRVVARLAPLTAGPKAATMDVIFPQFPSAPLSLKLKGRTKRQESAPTAGLVVIDKAPVGQQTNATANFLNQGFDASTITFAGRISGNPAITAQPILQPIIIGAFSSGQAPTPLNFTVIPIDTGWIEAQFKISLTEPCPVDTFITVRAYGVSPIITAPRQRSFSTACSPERFDTIPVQNTGNADLVISSASISGSPNFSIVGWFRNSSAYPRVIAPGERDSIVILFKTASTSPETAVLSLINNDSTKTNGKKTPFDIDLNSSFLKPQVSSQQMVDLGKVCVDEENSRKFFVRNTGDADATLSEILLDPSNFRINITQGVIPAKDSLQLTVAFKPKKAGKIQDSIVILTDPCGERTVIAIQAEAIETKLAYEPGEVFKEVRTGKKTIEQIKVTSEGTTSAIITAIRLEPADRTDMRLVQIPSPLPVLEPGQSINIAIEFNPAADTIFDGKIIIETAPQCLGLFQMKFFVRAASTRLQFNESALSFIDETCVPDSSYDTLTFLNTTALPINITDIEVPNDNYTIVYPAGKNLTIDADSPEKIIVRYSFKSPSTGDKLIVTTDESVNNVREFPLTVKAIENIRPQLTFKNLDLGDFRLNSSGDGVVEITNSTNYLQTVTQILPVGIPDNSLQFTLPALPLKILPGATVSIPVHFDALKIDTITAFLKVVSETLCQDTNTISATARVPYAQYPFTVSIGNYFAAPPDTVAIPVVIESDFSDAMVHSISFTVIFNEKLAYPLEVISNTGQPLPYTFVNGVFELTVDTNSFVKMPLGEAGEIFTMHVLAMPRSPYSTPLDIDKVVVSSRYAAIPVLKDGSLTVEYCLPITGFNLLPTFQANVLSNGSGSIQCEIVSTGAQNITFELINIFGISQVVKTGDFTKGNSHIEIPTAEIPSGTYFLKAQSSTGTLERIKVTIVK